MVNATAMVSNAGYDYLVNESKFNIVKAAVEGWQFSGYGVAAFIMFSFLVLIVGLMVYIRTQKMLPTVFILLLMTYIIDYYNLLDIAVYGKHGIQFIWLLYGVVVLFTAGAYIYTWWNDT